jgi:hypothetical protein
MRNILSEVGMLSTRIAVEAMSVSGRDNAHQCRKSLRVPSLRSLTIE